MPVRSWGRFWCVRMVPTGCALRDSEGSVPPSCWAGVFEMLCKVWTAVAQGTKSFQDKNTLVAPALKLPIAAVYNDKKDHHNNS